MTKDRYGNWIEPGYHGGGNESSDWENYRDEEVHQVDLPGYFYDRERIQRRIEQQAVDKERKNSTPADRGTQIGCLIGGISVPVSAAIASLNPYINENPQYLALSLFVPVVTTLVGRGIGKTIEYFSKKPGLEQNLD